LLFQIHNLCRYNADPRGMGASRPSRGEAFGTGVFECDDPDEDVFRTKTRGGDEIGHTYEIMSEVGLYKLLD
jgi:G patch domain-containing protein 1